MSTILMTEKAELIREAIEKANRKLEATFVSGDARAVASFYTEDAILMPTGSEPLQGTASIADLWGAVLSMGIKEVKLETREVDAQGATAIEMGQYTLRGGTGDVMDRGKYIVIWKLIQGEWKLHRDIWNSSLSQH
jgi:ketosteroid isomerase-like protein